MLTSLLEGAVLSPLNLVLFIGLPYAVILLFFVMSIRRYVTQKFSVSSFSSQFLENKHHFWGSVPWHVGILVLLLGHAAGFLIPREVMLWNSVPVRLWVFELSGLIFAFLALTGLLNLILRRMTDTKVRAVTSKMDWVLLAMLLVQIGTGIWVALFERWGSNWFAAVIAPYLRSLFVFSPDASGVVDMPLWIKIHILGAYAIFGIFPFTRLMHVLVVPNPYLWRRPQVVIFNRKPQGRA